MVLGKVKEIWRYPVKSMGGEQVSSGMVNNSGLAGDRCWAIIDSDNNEICHAKRWPELLNHRARLLALESLESSGFDDEVPDVEVLFGDGSVVSGRASDCADSLSEKLGRPVRLAPLAPPSNRDHYRLARKRTAESMAQEINLLEGEAFPDISNTPQELRKALADCVTPPGTYVDAYPLHLLTTNSMQYLREHGNVDAIKERYRPNLLVEASSQLAELTENAWIDYRLQVGGAILRVHNRTVRCSMPAREQQWCDVTADKKMMRAMVDNCDRHLGVYIMVEQSGLVSVDDELIVLSSN